MDSEADDLLQFDLKLEKYDFSLGVKPSTDVAFFCGRSAILEYDPDNFENGQHSMTMTEGLAMAYLSSSESNETSLSKSPAGTPTTSSSDSETVSPRNHSQAVTPTASSSALEGSTLSASSVTPTTAVHHKPRNTFASKRKADRETNGEHTVARSPTEVGDKAKKKRRQPTRLTQEGCDIDEMVEDDDDPNKIDERIANKCRGEFLVEFNNLRQPPPKYRMREIDQDFVTRLQTDITEAGNIGVTILPVLLVEGQAFTPQDPSTSQYYTLGGNHLREAQQKVDASLKVRICVYENLSVMEATRVGFLHNLASHQTKASTFEDKVTVCRRLLYHINHSSEEEEPPPTDYRWKHSCAVALGKTCSGTPQEIEKSTKNLGPLLQVARYSRRCWEQVTLIFRCFHEETGKNLSQTVFLKLQGLPSEEDRFNLLEACANGEISVKEMGEKAAQLKRQSLVEKHVVRHFKCKDIQEAYREYPELVTKSKIDEFVQAKDDRGSFIHQFTRDSVSIGFSQYFEGIEEVASEERFELLRLNDQEVVLSENCFIPLHCKGVSLVFHEVGKVPLSKLNQASERLKKEVEVMFIALPQMNLEKIGDLVKKLTDQQDFVGEINCGGQVAEIALKCQRNSVVIVKKDRWDDIKSKFSQ